MKPIYKQVLEKVPTETPGTPKVYSGSKIAIFEPGIMLSQQVQVDLYEFIVPISDIPPIKVEKKKFSIGLNKVLPVNPGQLHGGALTYDVPCRYLAIFIDVKLMQEISRTIYGKSEVWFKSDSFTYDDRINHLLQMFMNEATDKQSGCELILQSLATYITVSFLRSIKSNLTDTDNSKDYFDKENIKKAIEFLNESYNSEYSLDTVASLANLSPYHFIRVFKSQTGKTPYEYLMNVKIEKAKEMLHLRQTKITCVCFQCGFKNHSHFTTVFRKMTGVSPSQYRKIILGE